MINHHLTNTSTTIPFHYLVSSTSPIQSISNQAIPGPLICRIPVRFFAARSRERHPKPKYNVPTLSELILNRPLPAGRDLFCENPRLEFSPYQDPLRMNWPHNKNLQSIDPQLTRTWEDDLFDKVRMMANTKTPQSPIQGGDWGNNRIGSGIPPRIKLYYAKIVDNMHIGRLLSAIRIYETMIEDPHVNFKDIPYGIYHHMLKIHKARGNLQLAMDMLYHILEDHLPQYEDYALGMECLVELRKPQEALNLWDSMRRRVDLIESNMLTPSTECWNAMMKAHATLTLDCKRVQSLLESIRQIGLQCPQIDVLSSLRTFLELCSQYGWKEETLKLIQSPDQLQLDDLTKAVIIDTLNKLGEYKMAEKYYSKWTPNYLHFRDSPSSTSMHSPMTQHNVELINAAIETQAHLGNSKKVSNLLEKLHEFHIVPTLDTASHLIRHQHVLDLNSYPNVAIFVGDALGFKTIRSSIRNFRAILTAQMASCIDDPAQVQAICDTLEHKFIEIDNQALHQLCRSYALNHSLDKALACFKKYASHDLIPLPQTFTVLFQALVGMNRKRPNIAYKLIAIARELQVLVSGSMASAAVISIQNQGHIFGRLATRQAWQYWTSLGQDSRTLTVSQTNQFYHFIETIAETIDPNELQEAENVLSDWTPIRDNRLQILNRTVRNQHSSSKTYRQKGKLQKIFGRPSQTSVGQ